MRRFASHAKLAIGAAFGGEYGHQPRIALGHFLALNRLR